MQTTIAEGHAVSRHPTVDPHHDSKEKHSGEIEMRVESSATASGAASISDLKAQTKGQRLRARVQFATVCGSMYVAGWNDGSTGPLLPRIQTVYGVGGFTHLPQLSPKLTCPTVLTAEFCCGISGIRVRMCCTIPLLCKNLRMVSELLDRAFSPEHSRIYI
ncbi:hypothetical protein DFH29DRAFT_606851 [Suillus ampliporus]|nr:hypothetical protein DFH29DRAFT_606851 [Suillus ampliporus]